MIHPPRLLITAGPTREPIDRVRYIGNRSSGRLGRALALAAAKRGVPTTLFLGPVDEALVPVHSHLNVHRFQTTDDLQHLLTEHWPAHDILIMAAAVADYRPRPSHEAKLSRNAPHLILELQPTPDLLAELAPQTRPDQAIIGFALEPRERLEASARDKLHRKGLDAIIANPLETMDSDRIEAIVFAADGATHRPPPPEIPLDSPPDSPSANPPDRPPAVPAERPTISKEAFAGWLLDLLPHLRGSRHPQEHPSEDVARP